MIVPARSHGALVEDPAEFARGMKSGRGTSRARANKPRKRWMIVPPFASECSTLSSPQNNRQVATGNFQGRNPTSAQKAFKSNSRGSLFRPQLTPKCVTPHRKEGKTSFNSKV